jgi:hypothetical protein
MRATARTMSAGSVHHDHAAVPSADFFARQPSKSIKRLSV